MGLAYQDEPVRVVYERLIGDCGPGVSYLSLHCCASGEIEFIHPTDYRWRVAEYELFGDPGFVQWVGEQGVEISSVAALRRS